MWSATKNEVPRHHIIENAIHELEVELTAVFDEGPSEERVERALQDLIPGSYLNDVYARRLRAALFHLQYDPATRFRAAESALELMKRQFGK